MRLASIALLSCGALLASASASAAPQPAKARIEALVAAVSSAAGPVDPALQRMAKDFKRNGLAYKSFKLAQQASLDLAEGEMRSVGLPNGTAKVTLLKREADGKLRIKVIAPGSSSEYSMGPSGEVYIDAGAHAGGKVFLLLRR
jgi:ABC-type phosphate transport system substrate-binding protein